MATTLPPAAALDSSVDKENIPVVLASPNAIPAAVPTGNGAAPKATAFTVNLEASPVLPRPAAASLETGEDPTEATGLTGAGTTVEPLPAVDDTLPTLLLKKFAEVAWVEFGNVPVGKTATAVLRIVNESPRLQVIPILVHCGRLVSSVWGWGRPRGDR